MAIYAYRCAACGREEEVWQSISSYCVKPNRPWCVKDDAFMDRKITPVLMSTDVQAPYVSPIDGTVISSKSAERDHMIKHGVARFDEVMPDVERAKKRIAHEQAVERKSDLIEAVHRVEAGHKPVVIPESEFMALS